MKIIELQQKLDEKVKMQLSLYLGRLRYMWKECLQLFILKCMVLTYFDKSSEINSEKVKYGQVNALNNQRLRSVYNFVPM